MTAIERRVIAKRCTDAADDVLEILAPVWLGKPFKPALSKAQLREQPDRTWNEWCGGGSKTIVLSS